MGISNNVVCTTSKVSDQPAHTHSLIRAFCWSLEHHMAVKLPIEYELEFLSFNGSCTGSSESRFEPRHEISNNVVCTTSKASNQPAHTPSLIKALAIHLNIMTVKLPTEYDLEF